ncbi:hypothetical protein ACF08B_29905 [Streptomyces sp. NPDC015139]|uniref:hypothetical protein n=1 Tax=Streptomyces sp. NPDC015139 TaxID=3364942 RepID=UPI0036FC388D
MSDAFTARLSPKAHDVLTALPDHARQIVRDALDIAGRDPWAFPPFDSRDPEGEDVRSASVGQLTSPTLSGSARSCDHLATGTGGTHSGGVIHGQPCIWVEETGGPSLPYSRTTSGESS